jgi:GNAT superfamily N-acetyltransferase
MEQTIRQATGADLPSVFSMLEAYLAAIGESGLEEAGCDRIAAAIDRGDIVFFVARDGEEPVGLCSITIGFSTYKASPFALLEDYYVAESHRGEGTARLLVEAAAAFATARGCASILAGCSNTDVPMWSHLGFMRLANLMAKDL